MKRVVALSAVMAALVLVALSCDTPVAVERHLTLAWLEAPPASLREGDLAAVRVELRDADGRSAVDFDGASVQLRFVFQSGDSFPATSCGAACTVPVSQGSAGLTVAWISAGTWTASACVRPPAGGDELCVQHGLEVLRVHAALVTYPVDSVGRRVRFPLEARLRLPDGTAVTDQARTVRLRFTSPLPEPVGGRVRCPEAGPMCERIAIAGVVRLDSAMAVDTGSTIVTACVVTPNGRERCDPAGARQFRVVLPQAILRFATEPSGGPVGVPFGTQPVIEALEPDGTRRTDLDEIVTLALDDDALAGPVLAGTAHDGAVVTRAVTLRFMAGVATGIDLRVNRSGAGYRLVASAPHSSPVLSGLFDAVVDAEALTLAKVAGDGQHARVGTRVPVAPEVLVTGILGDPIIGVAVTFSLDWGHVANPVATSGTNGIATPGAWTLAWSDFPGAELPASYNELRAHIEGGEQKRVIFTAEAVDATQYVFVVRPSNMVAGEAINPAIVVELQDDRGRIVAEATSLITLHAYRVTDELGTRFNIDDALLGTLQVATTGGRAEFANVSITSAGPTMLEAAGCTQFACPPGFLALPPIEDFISVSAGSATRLSKWQGDSQTAIAGAVVPISPQVVLADIYGNPTPQAGVTVTFTVLGGGSVADPVQMTGVQGWARSGAWRLDPVPGVNTLTATAGGFAPATFLATGTVPTFDASAVSAGWDFTCATAQTTNLPYCWGDNTYSQLGEGTQTARSRPTLLAGGLLQLTQVTGGFRFACGLATNGAAYCWGNNFYGQLGIDAADLNQHATPEGVVGGHTFTQISAGFGHVCALDTDGAVWCWGATSEGSLGVATATPFQPVHVNSLLHFTQIDVGGNTSCALAESGDIWCWGNNGYGQLGNNSTDARSYVPVQVAGGRTFTQISVGTFHACGLSTGSVYCWGRNVEAQLGIGFTSPTSEPGSAVPVAATGALGVTRQVAAGNKHTCAVNGIGEAYCWGDNTNGQLGDLTTTLRTSGVQVRTSAQFVAITAGLLHTCALRASGATYCWGSNGSGRFGIGTSVASDYKAPVPVVVP